MSFQESFVVSFAERFVQGMAKGAFQSAFLCGSWRVFAVQPLLILTAEKFQSEYS